MDFVQSTFLIALAGLAVPVIIHLIHGRQTRPVSLGTIRFLSELLQETARKRKVKRWLLLALRLGCVSLLAFLFARPFLLAQQADRTNRLTIFLIDQSASMSLTSEGHRLIDQALARVKDLVKAQSGESEFRILFFDTEIHSASRPPSESLETAMDRLQTPSHLSSATSYGTALAAARELCLKSNAPRQDVYLLTDLQRSGLDWSEETVFPESAHVHLEDFGREGISNVAVMQVVPAKLRLLPGEGTTIGVTLFNHGSFTLEDISVLLRLKQKSRSILREEKVSLSPGQPAELEFTIPALDPGLWEGAVSVDVDDELPFDNNFAIALLSARQQRVLLIDGTGKSSTSISESFFLERAISLARPGETSSESPFIIQQTLALQEGALPALNETDLVVLSNIGPLQEEDAKSLADFVQKGGGLLIIPGNRTTPEQYESLQTAGLAPGTMPEIVRTMELPFRWETWEIRNDLLAPFHDPQSGDLQRLRFSAYLKVNPASQTRILARYSTGDPALTDQSLGRGRVLWFLSGCDPSWGNWTRSRLFLPLVHQMLGDLAHLTGGGPLQLHRLDEWDVALGPDMGEPHAGILEHNGRWHVFNPNERESETERCSKEELAERFGFILSDSESGSLLTNSTEIPVAGVGVESRRDEIWPWCAGMLLGILCLEWFMSNRTVA